MSVRLCVYAERHLPVPASPRQTSSPWPAAAIGCVVEISVGPSARGVCAGRRTGMPTHDYLQWHTGRPIAMRIVHAFDGCRLGLAVLYHHMHCAHLYPPLYHSTHHCAVMYRCTCAAWAHSATVREIDWFGSLMSTCESHWCVAPQVVVSWNVLDSRFVRMGTTQGLSGALICDGMHVKLLFLRGSPLAPLRGSPLAPLRAADVHGVARVQD